LRPERSQIEAAELIYGENGFPVSRTLFDAVALLAIGPIAIASMVFNVGPFGARDNARAATPGDRGLRRRPDRPSRPVPRTAVAWRPRGARQCLLRTRLLSQPASAKEHADGGT